VAQSQACNPDKKETEDERKATQAREGVQKMGSKKSIGSHGTWRVKSEQWKTHPRRVLHESNVLNTSAIKQ